MSWTVQRRQGSKVYYTFFHETKKSVISDMHGIVEKIKETCMMMGDVWKVEDKLITTIIIQLPYTLGVIDTEIK